MSVKEGQVIDLYPSELTVPTGATEDQRMEILYRMRERNYPWSQIAEHLDFPSPDAARKAYTRSVKAAAEAISAYAGQEHLAVLLGRLDSMLGPLWPAIDQGDVPSINAGRQLVMDQARLLGLIDRDRDKSGAQGTTVIISPDSMLAQMAERVRGEVDGAAS